SVDQLRLIGINSPERDECYSAESHAYLESLLEGEMVTLERDRTDRDRFDRLLRYVYLEDGTLVNEVMVEEGMAIARRYPPDTSLAKTLEAAQSRAKDAVLGLWAPDACGNATNADLAVTEIYYDPPGNETEDLNAEYIVISNNGGPLDMGGWGIRDESSSNRFTFPEGFSLGSGASVTIHSGCGDQSTTDLYWCSSHNAVWNNDGDTVFIQDPSGNSVVSRNY
ncbi:MAG: hypothetical protein GEU79_17645, partial [Acidimicrobiia bacterium]|nr:hypothetical protein [Acidimicrobiia bacterium]